MKVIYAKQALVALGASFAWLRQDGAGDLARERARRLAKLLKLLGEEHGIHPPLDTPQTPQAAGYRKLVAADHVVIYRVVDGRTPFVRVTGVFAPGRFIGKPR